nr:uncharacterized protein LOC109158994 [Ipomoea batatas]
MTDNGKIFSSQRSAEDQDLLERSTKKSKVSVGDPGLKAMDIAMESPPTSAEGGPEHDPAISPPVSPMAATNVDADADLQNAIETVPETQTGTMDVQMQGATTASTLPDQPPLGGVTGLVYFDRVQFKGMRVNRTYPTIVGWSAELARKRVREENKAGSFGRGTVLPRISKPADIAAATSRQNDQPPVAALNIPSSSVDKVAGILQKLASTVGEFGEAMSEIGKQGAPVNVMRKTFSGLSNMLNVASTIEATATPTSSQLDDIFFGSESFTTAVDALIFFPVLRHGHYFLICINVKASKLEIIDNKSLVSDVTMKDKYGDCTTLLEEFLIGLRARYAATIIRWSANILKNIVIKKTKLLYNKK